MMRMMNSAVRMRRIRDRLYVVVGTNTHWSPCDSGVTAAICGKEGSMRMAKDFRLVFVSDESPYQNTILYIPKDCETFLSMCKTFDSWKQYYIHV